MTHVESTGAESLRSSGNSDRKNDHIYEFWEHGQSGAVFAIRLNRKRQVTGCLGPLFSNQIQGERLAVYGYDDNPKDLRWIEAHRENWTPSDLQSPPHC